METHKALCPTCMAIVDIRHDGTQQDKNDYASPWVFLDHERDEENVTRPCSASRKNIAEAERSH